MVETRDHQIIAVSNEVRGLVFHHLEEDRFTATLPRYPGVRYFGWGTDQIALLDRAGEWWVATGEGVLRFPPVARVEDLAHTAPRAVYNTHTAGLTTNDVFRLFEDSRGDIWMGAINSPPVRWQRRTDRCERMGTEPFGVLPKAFAEDRAGNVWMAAGSDTAEGGVASTLVRF